VLIFIIFFSLLSWLNVKLLTWTACEVRRVREKNLFCLEEKIEGEKYMLSEKLYRGSHIIFYSV